MRALLAQQPAARFEPRGYHGPGSEPRGYHGPGSRLPRQHGQRHSKVGPHDAPSHLGFPRSSSSSSSFLAQPALPSPRSRTTQGRGRQALAPMNLQREALPLAYSQGRHGLPSPKKKRQLAPLHANLDPRLAGAPLQRAPDCDYSTAPATYRPPPPHVPKLNFARLTHKAERR